MMRFVFALLTAFACVATPMSAQAAVQITEFAASNLRGLSDEDGNHEDWIELFNDGSTAVSLQDWCLTDNSEKLAKWRFPNTNIGPGQFLLVFASEKDRRIVGRPLHTNFKLGANGEYLALVQPDGVTIATQFSPAFPQQVTDLSYGFPAETVTTVLARGAPVKWKVWASVAEFNSQSSGWQSSRTYAASGWVSATSGLGWDDTIFPVDFSPYFGSNSSPRSLMLAEERSVYTRFLPRLTNVASAIGLRLRMKFDDGFIAWLNGTLVASNLPPLAPAWNSLAGGTRDDVLNGAWATFNLPLTAAVEGTNLLAIQLFNNALNSSDLLLLPELDLVTRKGTAPAYLSLPTPGQTNGPGTTSVPPSVETLASVARPPGGPGSLPINIRALVTQTLFPVTNVMLFYRTMFAADAMVVMNPTTGGVYSVSIPTTALKPGEMLRWRIEARDAGGNVGTGPLFLAANDDDRYYGTVAWNPSETNSRLPVLHWFVDNYSATANDSGGRCSFFFLDRFYDNILVKLHGQSTSGFPKRGQDLDFNAGNRFTWRLGEMPAKDVNLLSNWGDKSKVRNTLAYEMLERSGVLCHWAFPVRIQTNGGFYAVLDLVEDGDDRFTERVGLNSRGALYKVYTAAYDGGVTGTTTWEAEKKARKDEGNADLAAFSAGVAATSPMAQRRSYLYDNINIAATINYLAAIVLSSCTDQGHKNFYLYRDSEGTREWRVLPWDVDLTFGHDWSGGPAYFDDSIYVNQPLQLGAMNSLKEIFFGNTELNQMFLRRLRTLMDTVLQPASTPSVSRTNENRIAELLDLIDPPGVSTSDADLDFAKWGWWTNGIQRITVNPAQGIRPQARRIVDTFLPGRRGFLQSNVRSSGAPIPPRQASNPGLLLEIGDFSPAGGHQDQEYVLLRNPNSFAVDISGWTLKGAIDYEFPPGTVIPSGAGTNGNIGALFVAKNPFAFRQRGNAPRGGQYCLVSGPYSGQLSARGETVKLEDAAHRPVASVSYAGNPSLCQRFLRVTEIMYNPAPFPGSVNEAQEFEFIELRNTSVDTTLDLNGVRFSSGITFGFTNSWLLPPQAALVISRNPGAFFERYGNSSFLTGPSGDYLDNGSQRLTLLDAANEEILDFTYHDSWFPLSDGLGFSLVVVDELAAPDTWNSASQWRSSGSPGGSPGASDFATGIAPIQINEVLAHTDLPQVDTIELYNPTANRVDLGGWFLTDDVSNPMKFRIPSDTWIQPWGFFTLNEHQFGSQTLSSNNFRLSSTGDDVWLLSGDALTNLTGYSDHAAFGASPNGVSFGRHVTTDGTASFVPQLSLTLGATNSGPVVGPVIIRSVMYHPPDAVINGVAFDDAATEFVELLNTASTNVAFFDERAPTNTWRLTEAINFSFPANLVLPAGSNLLVVGFDPAHQPHLANFLAKWAYPDTITVLGPWTGKLDNSGDDIQLERPDPPNLDGSVPFILVERLRYSDHGPWPAAADGYGASLQRKNLTSFGDDPANWCALPPFGASTPDNDQDRLADWWEVVHGLSLDRDDSPLDPDGDGVTNLQEFASRTDPRDAGSILQLRAASDPSGALVLSLDARPQVAYAIQTNATLKSDGWATWTTVSAVLTNRHLILTDAIFEGPRFYRLRVESP